MRAVKVPFEGMKIEGFWLNYLLRSILTLFLHLILTLGLGIGTLLASSIQHPESSTPP
jgi:hypothetical protein